MTHIAAPPSCPLCRAVDAVPFYQDRRTFLRCPLCQLVFVPPHEFLTPAEEKAVYDQHQNSPDDEGYRQFLSRLFVPMSRQLAPGSHGLDFGSGPGPTLSVMFQEAGHSMEVYDPFYAPDTAPLAEQYDFITASEVVEHLHDPRGQLERLWSCLKPNGILGIMTKRVVSQEAFSQWHYKNDPTHVGFFSIETFEYLAEHWQAALTVADADVVLFSKTGSAADVIPGPDVLP